MPMNEIQAARYNSLLHKLLAMKEGAPSPLLAPEIFPVIQLEEPQPDWPFLQGIYRKGWYREMAAVVAEYSHLELANPAGSGALIVLTRIQNLGAAASIWLRSALGVVIGSPQLGANMDSRAPRWGDTVGQSSALQLGAGSSGAILGTPLSYQWMLQGDWHDLHVVLTPGSTLMVVHGTVNTAMSASLRWYERHFEPSESR